MKLVDNRQQVCAVAGMSRLEMEMFRLETSRLEMLRFAE